MKCGISVAFRGRVEARAIGAGVVEVPPPSPQPLQSKCGHRTLIRALLDEVFGELILPAAKNGSVHLGIKNGSVHLGMLRAC